MVFFNPHSDTDPRYHYGGLFFPRGRLVFFCVGFVFFFLWGFIGRFSTPGVLVFLFRFLWRFIETSGGVIDSKIIPIEILGVFFDHFGLVKKGPFLPIFLAKHALKLNIRFGC